MILKVFFVTAAVFSIIITIGQSCCLVGDIVDGTVNNAVSNVGSVTKSLGVSSVLTSSGKDIFEVFDGFSVEVVIDFFKKKGQTDFVTLYESYKSSDCDDTRKALRQSLCEYYNNHSQSIDSDVEEFTSFATDRSYSSTFTKSTSETYSANEVSSSIC
ncbi:uncharacterized protein LOC126908149 [Daktulosphaira vitifoliae]|uniref:uncharacterized protein LOC126908149 n=1 Tax=Daktulosphaira vitifoliae TaxID=58002 RepID=UPI0021A9831E|nr:uncharacterized protein LOC126908149 [Daktulosphaira vitifoliae]